MSGFQKMIADNAEIGDIVRLVGAGLSFYKIANIVNLAQRVRFGMDNGSVWEFGNNDMLEIKKEII